MANLLQPGLTSTSNVQYKLPGKAVAASSHSSGPIVDVREGNSPDRPAFFARAYVPVQTDGRHIAVVAAYVDELFSDHCTRTTTAA